MSNKTLHLIEDLLAALIAVLLGIYLCACWVDAAYIGPAKAELVDAYYSEGLRVPGMEKRKAPATEITVTKVAPAVAQQPTSDQSLGWFNLTAYCPCSKCCGEYANGITATGTTATAGRTIAVDPKVIPYGTHVLINGHEYVAEDCGGRIKSNRIDIFFATHDEALQFGIGQAEVFVCD